MKRIFLALIIVASSTNISHAQIAETVQNQNTTDVFTPEDSHVNEIVPYMKYKTLKNIYNYKDYVKSDIGKHSVGGCGWASFFIPGLGQMICGEVGRGFAWLGGYLAAYTAVGVGGVFVGSAKYYVSDQLNNAGTAIALIGFASMATLDIWSIVDAVRVAKVKNMYENDLVKKYTFDVDLYPSVNYIKTASGIQPTAGLTFALKF